MTVPESIGLSGTGHVQPLRRLMVSSVSPSIRWPLASQRWRAP